MHSLWYPLAKRATPELKTLGDYEKGYPRGAVIHYTAGPWGLDYMDLARAREHCYMVIQQDGTVIQGAPLDRWGSHAGASSWWSLNGRVSQHLVGIEIECAGKLEGDKTWWGDSVPMAQQNLLFQAEVDSDGGDNRAPGVYQKFTKDQEQSLRRLILWLKSNNPDVFDLDLVLGHDEVSPGRKTDPGGSLSMSMPQLRSELKREFRIR